MNKGVVEQKHDGGEIPGNLGVPKQHLANITHISDFRVTQTELPVVDFSTVMTLATSSMVLPDNERSVEYKSGLNNGQDDARN